MKNILFIDACINRSISRTERLVQAYFEHKISLDEYRVQHLVLEETAMLPLSDEVLKLREAAASVRDYSGEIFRLARDFAAADEVIIAAPYWDLGFPALFKLYLEQICVNGLTFCYSENGCPCGLTNIKSVLYFTTSGGYIGDKNFGFDYVNGLFSTLFNISDIRFFSAEGLDIRGNDPEKLLTDAVNRF